jgi:hypothetical protein
MDVRFRCAGCAVAALFLFATDAGAAGQGAPVLAQPAPPTQAEAQASSPAFRQGMAFLAAATGGDEAAFLKFVADNAAAVPIPQDRWRDLVRRRYLGHGGSAPGMNGELRIFPDDGYTVVVLANRDPPAAMILENFIGDRLP